MTAHLVLHRFCVAHLYQQGLNGKLVKPIKAHTTCMCVMSNKAGQHGLKIQSRYLIYFSTN